jgi:hypothetical protein
MYNGLMPKDIDCSFWCLILIASILGIVWFFLDGFLITGFLKRKIEIKSNAFDTKIIIQFGDLFEQDGWKAVPVNEFFDSLVDDKHISAESLHGIFLQKFWAGNIADWDKQIDNSLSENDLLEEINRNSGKTKRYRIGATAIAEKGDNKFLCVALTKTHIGSLQAEATPIDLLQALSGLLLKAREICAGSALNIPLLGSGLSRTGIKLNILVDLALMVIFDESKKSKITDNIRIILPKNKIKEIDLNTLQKDWR